jgi:hypothetical protein
MTPFRFADTVFNPQAIVYVTKDTREMKTRTDYFVTVFLRMGPPVSLRVIDPIEQEGTLQDFLAAWLRSL